MKIIFLCLSVVLLAACTHTQRNLDNVGSKQDERVRELVQGALIANSRGQLQQYVLSNKFEILRALELPLAASNTVASASTNLSKSTAAYDLSKDHLERAQSLTGMPAVDQTEVIDGLLSEVKELRNAAVAKDQRRQVQESVWLQKEREYQAKLQEMGAKYEAERNKHIIRRIWEWSIGTLGFGGLIALCVFCPAVIPILGRLIGAVVSRIPALANFLGVVGKNAFDAVVRGVGEARNALKSKPEHATALQTIDSHLADQQETHTLLVEARRAAVNV